nr:EAL domain-containing protein [Halobacillus andaensis]
MLPDTGAVVVNKQREQSAFQLPVHYEDQDRIIHNYHSQSQLLESLHIIFQKSNPNEWIHILNKDHSQSFPINVQHLYERMKHPELASVIYKGAFKSHLQPIVYLEDYNIFGYESLLRTTTANVSPGDLFSFAHNAGLHSMLDQKARRAAVQAKSEQIDQGQKIFINFLPSTIYVPEFCLKHTFQMVKEFDIDPKDIIFEVVETEKITDVNHLKSIFDTYKASGMKVALDDVGAGFSTLEMLTLLQPDYVKIDRSYIQDCHQNLEHQNFLKEVINRATHFGIYVLAEGIETKEEADWLRSAGIHFGQGYYFGKPSTNPQKKITL